MAPPFIIADEAGRQHALDRIADLDLADKRWEITVKRHRKRRSTKQNNLYHAWVDEVAGHMSDTTGYERAEVHAFFKSNFLEPGGDIQIKGLTARADVTTTTLNTAEMSAYMDTIYRWVSAEFGFALRLPPVIIEEGYDGPPPKSNDADDDWQVIANDIIALIDQAPNRGRLDEIDAINERALIAMKTCAFDLYNRVMDAMERRGFDLDRKNGPAQSPHGEPARQKAGVG